MNKFFVCGQTAKKLAEMGDGCYPVGFVLLAKIYCKPLITGNL